MEHLFLETTISMHVAVKYATEKKEIEQNQTELKQKVHSDWKSRNENLSGKDKWSWCYAKKKSKVNHQVAEPKDGGTYANFVTLAA